MLKKYRDYRWKEGLPYGVEELLDFQQEHQISFKIVSDPYKKRVSIEKYKGKKFEKTVYDSALFDFRNLKIEAQHAWDKEFVDENTALIKDQNDRIILREEYLFEKDLCRECRVYSVHDILLSVQKMSYQLLGDSFDGVTLYDAEGREVMQKFYEMDEKGKNAEAAES